MCSQVRLALADKGVGVLSVRDGERAIKLTRSLGVGIVFARFDAIARGATQLLRQLNTNASDMSLVVSGRDIDAVVAGEMRGSGARVYQGELSADAVVAIVNTSERAVHQFWRGSAVVSLSPLLVRWVGYVCDARFAKIDPKTISLWARHLGVSYSTLCEHCRLVNVRPHDARDLARVLRAVLLSYEAECPISVLLDVSDRRTLHKLLTVAGLTASDERVAAVDFIKRQRFIPQTHQAVAALISQLKADTVSSESAGLNS